MDIGTQVLEQLEKCSMTIFRYSQAARIGSHPNPDLGIVIASETKQSDLRWQVILSKAKDLLGFGEIPHFVRDDASHRIAAHLSGARNDRLGKGFLFLNRDLDPTQGLWFDKLTTSGFSRMS